MFLAIDAFRQPGSMMHVFFHLPESPHGYLAIACV